MMVKGRMDKINANLFRFQHRLTRHLRQGPRSVDLLFLKPSDFDLLNRATHESITELQV